MGGGKLVRNNLLATTFLSLALGAASCTNETEQFVDSRTAPMSVQVTNHIASRGLITSVTLPVDASGIGVTLVNKSDEQKYDGQDGYSNMQWTTTNGTTWSIASGTNPNLTGTEGVRLPTIRTAPARPITPPSRLSRQPKQITCTPVGPMT